MSRRIPAEWNLPPALRQRIAGALGRQQALQQDGHLLLVLHRVPQDTELAREKALFYRDAEGQWQSSRAGEVGAQLQNLLHEYDQRINQLDEQLNAANQARACFEVLRSVFPVMRATRNLVAVLARAHEHFPADEPLNNALERAYPMERAAELLHEEAKASLDYAIAQESEIQSHVNLEMARSAHRLNLIVALFLPLTAIASLFGMNLVSGLEATGPWLFWAILGLAFVVGFLLRGFINSARVPLPAHLLKHLNPLQLAGFVIKNDAATASATPGPKSPGKSA